MKTLIDQMQDQADQALSLYDDKDNLRAEELDYHAGQHETGKTVWTSFYETLKLVKNYHRKHPLAIPEVKTPEWYIAHAGVIGDIEDKFSTEEAFGKRLDLHQHYGKWTNLKKYREYREKQHREETISRLVMQAKNKVKKSISKGNGHLTGSSKPGEVEGVAVDGDVSPRTKALAGGKVPEDDPEITEKLVFKEVDYIKWLQLMGAGERNGAAKSFADMPRYLKYRDAAYEQLLVGLVEYLQGFVERSQPLMPLAKKMEAFEQEFAEAWGGGRIEGWDTPTTGMGLYVKPTDRLFATDGARSGHLASKA